MTTVEAVVRAALWSLTDKDRKTNSEYWIVEVPGFPADDATSILEVCDGRLVIDYRDKGVHAMKRPFQVDAVVDQYE